MGIEHGNMALHNYMAEYKPMHQQPAMTPYPEVLYHS